MRLSLVAVGLSLACTAAFGLSIDDLQPGKTVLGPDLKVAEMRGKVVFVEYWGTV